MTNDFIGSAIGRRLSRYTVMLQTLSNEDKDIRRVFVTEGHNNKDINLHIDLNYFVSNLFDKYTVDSVPYQAWSQQTTAISIAEKIINLVAHYRNFFVKNFDLPANVYLYFSSEACEYKTQLMQNAGLVDLYRHSQLTKSFASADPTRNSVAVQITKAIKLAKAFLEYVPNAHLITTDKTFDSYAVPFVLGSGESINFHISNVTSLYSMIGVHSYYNTIALRLGNTNVKFVSFSSVYEELCRKLKSDYGFVKELSANGIRLFHQLAGDAKLSVKGIRGYSAVKTLKLIYSLEQNGELTDFSTIDIFQNHLKEDEFKIAKLNDELLNFGKYVSEVKTDADCNKILSQIHTKTALGELDQINSSTFNNRINTTLLFSGEQW